MVSDGFPNKTSCSTTTITSLGTFDENAKDGEIRMMVVEELMVTNSTGDRVAASKHCTYLAVVFPPIQQGSNIKCDDNYGTDSDHETNNEADSGYQTDIYETDGNYDSDSAPDSGYEPGSEEDSSDKGDSACGSDVSDTGTIRQDLIQEENGRKYHTYGCTEYWGPCDEEAKNQQDLGHHVWIRALDGKLFTAPVLNPKCILDLGTGTGIWAMDAADEYPSSHVIGIDVSVMQPAFIPPNVEFLVDDFNASSYEERQKYDLIHGRQLLGSVANWPQLIEKCYRALRPGGYLNLVEPSIHLKPIDTLEQNHPYPQWIKTFIEAGDKCGMSFDVSSRLEGWLKEAGFVGVEQRIKTVPVGGTTILGMFNQERLHAGVFDFSARRLAKVLGWTTEEIMVFVSRIRTEIRNPKLSVSQDFYFVHGQKPF